MLDPQDQSSPEGALFCQKNHTDKIKGKFKAFVLSMCELLYKDFIEMTHFSFELQKETVEGEQVVSETFSEAT